MVNLIGDGNKYFSQLSLLKCIYIFSLFALRVPLQQARGVGRFSFSNRLDRKSWTNLLFRVNLAESLPIVLKKEYGCHRRDILKTEQCLARQLESSMSASQIIMELNDLENTNSCSRSSKIWMTLFIAWLCPSIGSTAVDIFFDSLLAIQYYHQYNNNSYVNKSIEKCEECQQVFKSPTFNTTRTTIHCFEYCFSTEARLGYTLTFLLLPIIFYMIEFLTLTDRSILRCQSMSLT